MVTTLKASHIVKPAEPTPEELMYISECDQIKSLTNAPIVYFYRPKTDISLGEAAQILKDSLSKVLVRFYPLAGRLNLIKGGGGRLELHCNAMGALLVEAESDLKIDDFGDFCPTPEVRSLIPSIDFDATPIHELPVLLVQVTKLSCGGICLGTGISHILMDGQSAGHFMSEWTKTARGEHSDDHPFLDRKIFQQYESGDRASPELKLSDFLPMPVLLGQPDNVAERRKPTTSILLKLTKEQIETLKNKATNSYYSFSRFEAVCVHIWKCVSMARGLKPDQETILFVSVGFRNRVNPPLPKWYSGNAVMLLPVSSTAGKLLSTLPSHTARKIRTGIDGVTDSYVRSYLHAIKNTKDVSDMRHFHTVGCEKGSFFGSPNLMITSWVGLPIFGIDFGWGDEVFMGPGSLGYDGKIFVIPGRNGDGSFIIPLRLQVEHAAAFKKYFYEEI